MNSKQSSTANIYRINKNESSLNTIFERTEASQQRHDHFIDNLRKLNVIGAQINKNNLTEQQHVYSLDIANSW